MEPLLSPSDTGDWVQYLQERLLEVNFDPGRPDGDFGGLTEIAVQGFQEWFGLTVDGIVGPVTWRALKESLAAFTNASPEVTDETAVADDTFETVAYPDTDTPPATSGYPTLSFPDTGEWVGYLQERLRYTGFDPGPSDNVFGERTSRAVRGFQGAYGLVADGVVGPLTWVALDNAAGVDVGTDTGTDTGTGSVLDDFFDDYGGGSGGDGDHPKKGPKASQPPNVEDDLKESWCIPQRHIKSIDRAVIGQVFFSTNSDYLDSDDTNALNNLVNALNELTSSFPGVDPVRVLFRGHADPRGTDQVNLDLSSRRARQAQGYVVNSLPAGDPRFETDTHAMGEVPEPLPDVPMLFSDNSFERRVDIFSVGAPIVKSVTVPANVESQRQRIVRILQSGRLEGEPTKRLLCVFEPDIKRLDQYLVVTDPDFQKVLVIGQPRMSDAAVGAMLQRHTIRKDVMTEVYSPDFSDSIIASVLRGLDNDILGGIELVNTAQEMGGLNISRPFANQMNELIASSQRSPDSLYSCYR